MRITQAVIQAGGLGTRLGALTKETPKPLLPVACLVFLGHVIDWLARGGIEDVVLSTGCLPETFERFLDGRSWRNLYGGHVRVRAIADLGNDASRSLLIGDQGSDVGAAQAASVRGIKTEGGDLAGLVRRHLQAA